jgi:hypothetical protein
MTANRRQQHLWEQHNQVRAIRLACAAPTSCAAPSTHVGSEWRQQEWLCTAARSNVLAAAHPLLATAEVRVLTPPPRHSHSSNASSTGPQVIYLCAAELDKKLVLHDSLPPAARV